MAMALLPGRSTSVLGGAPRIELWGSVAGAQAGAPLIFCWIFLLKRIL